MDYEMMRGTNGNLDYLVVAKKGDQGLGLKFYGAGYPAQLPGKAAIWIEFRLRAAVVVPATEGDDAMECLKSLADTSETPMLDTSVWSGADWEKEAQNYSSTSVGVSLPTPQGTMAELDEVIAKYSPEHLFTKLREYLVKIAGESSITVTVEDLVTNFGDEVTKLVKAALANRRAELAAVETLPKEYLSGDSFTTMKALVHSQMKAIQDAEPEEQSPDDAEEGGLEPS